MHRTQTSTTHSEATPDRRATGSPRRRRWPWTVGLVVTTLAAFVLWGATSTAAAPARSTLDAAAARYATPGPHGVGVTTLAGTDALPALTHWYPAMPAPDSTSVTYAQRLLVGGPLSGVPVGYVDGVAVADAPTADLPTQPLVVLAPGYGVAASSYAWLAEHLASHGFAVVAHEADETLVSAMGDGLWQSAVDRPAVLAATVTHLQDLARAGRASWDPESVAVLGHSIGGHAALAVGGARLDTDAFAARCEAGDEDAAWLCGVLAPHLEALADRAGVTGQRHPLLAPDTGVKAVVALAGDAYLFDAAGLAAMTTPVLAIGGHDDTDTPWSLGTGMTIVSAGSEHRTAVGLEGAEHLVFTGRCDRIRRITPVVPMDLCDDADGERTTRHRAVAHVTTAFLLDTLGADTEAGALLDVDLPHTTITTPGDDNG